MAEQFTTLASLTVDGKGSYGIGASAVPFSKDLYTYLRITDIKDDGTLNLQDLKSVDDEKASEYLLKPNDIVFARTGASTGRNYFYDGTDGEFVYAGFLIKFSIDEKKVNPKYIKYFCQSKQYKDWINSFNTGSTRGNINAQTLGKMSIPLIERSAQDALVSILSSIDEKIKKNNEINNNLLEQALTLYATQFSSLELNGCIGDYCSVKSGFAFKSSWWTNSGIRVIKIGSINQDNLNLLECSYVDEDKADKAKDCVVKAGDLLIAMTGATIGKFAMVPYSSEMLLVNQRVGKFFLGNNPVEKLPFIYCTLKQPEVYGEVVNRGQGSAQPNISASDIMSIPCVIPSKDAINDFNNTSQPLFDLIIRNQRENQNLFELRNALLPKLMTGELDVSNIEL